MICIRVAHIEKELSGFPRVRPKSIYTDGQKKRCSKSLTCIACDSQARAVQAYHDQNLEPSIWFILICQLCLPGMLAIYICYMTGENPVS